MIRLFRSVGVLASLMLLVLTAQAQYPVDALRYSFTNLGSGARALSMGGAFVGVADDFSATFWNPAGLAQVRRFEISGGLENVGVSNDATYYGATQNYTNSVMNLGSIGVVIPFPTQRGSLALAVGYNRPADFTGAVSVNGFNPRSSIADWMYIDPSSVSGDMAYNLYLEDSTGNVRVNGNLNQVASILEEGRLGNWSFAGAIEAAPGLFLGASLDIYTGTYSYNREITETDTRGFYQTYQEGNQAGLQSVNLISTTQQDISGIGAKLGMLYRIADIARIGLTIKTPSVLNVRENWTDQGASYFATGTPTDQVSGNPNYDILTPWQFSGGASFIAGPVLLSASGEWTDYSQAEFQNSADQSVQNENNREIKNLFQSTFNYRVGAELSIPQTDLKIRAGYANLPSPYKGDPSSYAQQYLTFGAGYTFVQTLGIDVAYMRGMRDTFDYLYGDSSSGTRMDQKITTNNIAVTISYHF